MIPKFRAWTGDEWIYNVIPLSETEIIEAQLMTGETRIRKVKLVVMSTGLKDKNGVEIFEGDIIIYIDSFMGKSKAIIEWRYGGLRLVPIVDDDGEDFCADELDIEDKTREVIGNIHENPELLGASR